MNSCAFAALAAASTSLRVASGLPYLMFSRMLVANSDGCCAEKQARARQVKIARAHITIVL